MLIVKASTDTELRRLGFPNILFLRLCPTSFQEKPPNWWNQMRERKTVSDLVQTFLLWNTETQRIVTLYNPLWGILKVTHTSGLGGGGVCGVTTRTGPKIGQMFMLQHIVTDCDMLNVIFFILLIKKNFLKYHLHQKFYLVREVC